MRRWLWLVIPALALAGMIALNNTAAGWHYVVSGSPGDVLYAAGFDGFEDEWERYDDGRLAAAVTDGALRVTVDDAPVIAYSLAAHRFADFDLRVTATAVDGPLDNGYGVVFRFNDHDNYYTFQVSSDGYYQVRRVVGGEAKELSTWIPSDIVRQGLNAANSLRVVAAGDRFRFYVNDQPVELCIPNNPDARSTFVGDCLDGQMIATLADGSHASGRIGVIAESFAEPGVVVAFDDLIVLSPQPLE